MFLERSTFSTVIASAPLVSIDLMVENEQGQVLLGKRLNKPAQGYWFVPGGRIQKGETIEQAFKRLTLNELGKSYSIKQAELKGPYTHLYDDNVFGDAFGTHYVAIAYHLVVSENDLLLPMNEQHDTYQWFEQATLLESSNVHIHTKWYFQG
ncbi:GDP-mannose mannosyl hydrolase [Vibrio sp. Of7-15]|uniref:GDP-mannose mannosyl hydrolase n=1 Tax=Vibrio sp. Of7-15 TaxID=2724879 RepID=UPI001EF171D9|nr:GDP-mannose mannosyl hydrolase [Vibrio sp. Of7-15]MCG7496859.1 GDP-mannose mannosyl hydrolase [Vibrio sp. Of7-15]